MSTSTDQPAAPTADRTAGGSKPPTPPGSAPGLGPVELARWAWRQLTSMRTALVLLLLLALGAVPGSVVPQQDVNALATSRWQAQHPTLTPIYDALGLFSVFDSVWFSAIYILLMVSLVGCILPRTRVYWRGLRARPPRAPRNLSRLPQSRSIRVPGSPEDVLEGARTALRRRRYRVDVHAEVSPDGARSVAAERGYLREAGNLVFHVSVLVVLLGFAVGGLFGYKGGVIVVDGHSFSNTLSQYDDFAPGSLFGADDLQPFSLTVDSFDVSFLTSGPEAGTPKSFDASVTYHERPGAPARHKDLRVNDPLRLEGGDVFLVGHGYAPRITVRDGNGDVAYSGPTTFLPQDSTFASFGVVKAPDARPEQIGLEGMFYPTYGFTMARGPYSAFPDDLDPELSLTAYTGDLGLDTGTPQSVYQLDKSGLTPVRKTGGKPFLVNLAKGQTKQLPDGAGSVTFDGVKPWVKLQMSHSPGKRVALAGVILGLLGLLGSLFIRPRRVWVRVRGDRDDDGEAQGGSFVEVAGLTRSGGGDDLAGEIDALTRAVDPAPDPPRQDPREDT